MKNQKGVSMVTLVITIIVILILSAVTFVASLSTIEKTSYSKFTNNVSDVSAAFGESAAIVKGKKIMEDKEKYMEQIYNYVAKNGEKEEDFLSYMNVPKYTIITNEGQLGMDLPEMVVESGTGKKVPVKYAVTSTGEIFTWPPLDYDEKFYITAKDTVEHKMQTLIKVGEQEFEIKIDSGDGTLLDWPVETNMNNQNQSSSNPSGDGNNTPLDHEHIFFSKTQTPEYFCSEATCVLPKQYYYKCINCDAKGSSTYTVGAALGHQWGEETVVKQANCSEKGIIQRKCSVCGTFATSDEPLNPGNHHGTEIEEITKASTCAEEGTKIYKCSSCNAQLRTESIPTSGHNMDKSIITKQATCTETGIKTYKCSNCDREMKTEEIPALGHGEETFEITKQATCTETGTKKYKCLYCGKELRTEEIPVLGHDYGSFQETEEATCTEKGLRTKICIRCNDTITEETGALGHDYGIFTVIKEATCKEKGIMTQTCSRCSDEITEEIPIDTSKHYGNEEIAETKEATCTEDGTTTTICSLCKAVLQTQTISALGHLWTSTQAPRKCERCGLEEKAIQAVYTETDNTLAFIESSENYEAGGTYNGKIITAAYVGFAQNHFEATTTPWYSIRKNIKKVSFDTEISPVSTAYWFFEQENLTTIENINLLNTTQVDAMDNMFNGCKSLTSIDVSGFNILNLNNLTGMFSNCSTLTEITGLNNWNTSQITDMTSMFFKCTELTNLEISNWDTTNVTSFRRMFSDDGMGSMKLKQLDVSNWNTSSATDMMGMFEGCGELTSIDLSKWDVSKVTDLSYMFGDCNNITSINISGWNTALCETFNGMFNDCEKLVDINSNELDLDSCTDIAQIFEGCLSLKKLDLSSWNMSNIETSYEMFDRCYVLEEVTLGTEFRFVDTNGYLPVPDPLYIPSADGKWYNTETKVGYAPESIPNNIAATYIATIPEKIIAIYTAGNETLTFVKDAPKNIGDTYNGQEITAVYTNIEGTVYEEATVPWYQYRASIEIVNIADEIKPTSTAHWFNGFENCETFEVSKLDTSEITNMSYMFNNAGNNVTTFNITGMNDWNTASVTNMAYMFHCAGFNATTWSIGDLSNWNTASVTNMEYMLDGIGYSVDSLTIGNLDNWNTASVTNMEGMFNLAGYNATTFNIGDLSNWNTSSVNNMAYMFSSTGFNATTWSIGDLSNWNTSSVTNMEGMFNSAGYKSTTFNIGKLNNWDMSSVTDISHMFREAGFESTTWSIGDISNWNTNLVIDMSDMFAYTGNGASEVDFGDLSTKLVTSGDTSYTAWNVSNVTNMDNMFIGSNVKELNLSGWNNTRTTSMADMFTECKYLERVTLSNAFTFKGTTSYLPTPDSSYIPSADGKWYDIATSEGYAPANIPSNKAATYVATADLYTYNVVYQSSTGLELETSTLTKLFGTTNTITPREIIGYTTPAAQSVAWDSTTPKTITFIYDPIEYSITIDCNGGSGESSKSYTIETESFSLATPVREGYTFTGWTGSNGTTPEIFIGVVKGSTGALSYTANWSINEYEYEIVYESTTGITLGHTTVTEVFGTTKTITPPEITGYTTPVAQNVSWDSETPKTIIFTYSPISYSVTIDCNGGSGVSSTSYTVESETFTLGTPTREGYTFTGWTGSNGTTPETTVTIENGSTGAKSYTANWQENGIAQAIYSVTDNSLTFVKDDKQTVGGTYNNKKITAIYTGFDTDVYSDYSEVPWYDYCEDITSVIFEDEISPLSTAYWFYHVWNCTSFDVAKLDTSNVTDMQYMFCMSTNRSEETGVTTISGMNNWNTSKVTNMSYMFNEFGYSASTLDLGDISGWDTSSVTNMEYMFFMTGSGTNSSVSIGDLGNWNTGKVTDMSGMFAWFALEAPSVYIGDLSEWDTSNVTDMNGMFNWFCGNASTFNIGDISGWDTSKVTDMCGMFYNTAHTCSTFNLGDISKWNTSNVTNMASMFLEAGYDASYSYNLSGWNVNKVTDYSRFNEGVTSKITPPNWVN